MCFFSMFGLAAASEELALALAECDRMHVISTVVSTLPHKMYTNKTLVPRLSLMHLSIKTCMETCLLKCSLRNQPSYTNGCCKCCACISLPIHVNV